MLVSVSGLVDSKNLSSTLVCIQLVLSASLVGMIGGIPFLLEVLKDMENLQHNGLVKIIVVLGTDHVTGLALEHEN